MALERPGPIRPGSAAADGRLADVLRFALEWLKDPAGTAAIVPSGKALVELITRGIDGNDGPVLELGPGTGAFTQALLRRGVAERNLTLVEQNATFARLLMQRFPRATILDIDAARLDRRAAGTRAFGAAVCGLGLRNMPAIQVEAIIGAAFRQMAPGAALYLFTYGSGCSVPQDVQDRIGLSSERVGIAFRNVPPASVFRLVRRTVTR